MGVVTLSLSATARTRSTGGRGRRPVRRTTADHRGRTRDPLRVESATEYGPGRTGGGHGPNPTETARTWDAITSRSISDA